ncbi:histidine phosphatase family protein [Nonomuraea africana]|uniref:Broad specificity phosphatase PhoE n=1 Tax=Nonomuraea africana TaxID=46171 RepID=A0ABR9KU18_9ACTN|nr:histidine phosphatase family protein [Nonomuraea africana]MBE1565532.1 broad specificity phosphatase PhoE [Nonomuraea africana]
MLFVRHASTPAMRGARFPSGEEPADPSSLEAAARLAASLGSADAGVAFVSPARAAWETAVAMGFAPVVVAALAEQDHGRWRGMPYEEVAVAEPESFARWLADPGAAPHGGESRTGAAARVARWLDGLRESGGEYAGRSGGKGRVVAVCDVGVIRAALGHALGADPTPFDLAPLSLTQVSAAREGWRIGYVNRKAAS